MRIIFAQCGQIHHLQKEVSTIDNNFAATETLLSCKILGFNTNCLIRNIAPSPYLVSGLTEPNEKQQCLMFQKEIIYDFKTPTSGSATHCCSASKPHHERLWKTKSDNLFHGANPLEESVFVFQKISSATVSFLYPTCVYCV